MSQRRHKMNVNRHCSQNEESQRKGWPKETRHCSCEQSKELSKRSLLTGHAETRIPLMFYRRDDAQEPAGSTGWGWAGPMLTSTKKFDPLLHPRNELGFLCETKEEKDDPKEKCQGRTAIQKKIEHGELMFQNSTEKRNRLVLWPRRNDERRDGYNERSGGDVFALPLC